MNAILIETAITFFVRLVAHGERRLPFGGVFPALAVVGGTMAGMGVVQRRLSKASVVARNNLRHYFLFRVRFCIHRWIFQSDSGFQYAGPCGGCSCLNFISLRYFSIIFLRFLLKVEPICFSFKGHLFL